MDLGSPYLVGGWAYPSEKWWRSSVGMMKFPTEWKNNPNVPSHQPVIYEKHMVKHCFLIIIWDMICHVIFRIRIELLQDWTVWWGFNIPMVYNKKQTKRVSRIDGYGWYRWCFLPMCSRFRTCLHLFCRVQHGILRQTDEDECRYSKSTVQP